MMMSWGWKPRRWMANWTTTSMALASFCGNGTPCRKKGKGRNGSAQKATCPSPPDLPAGTLPAATLQQTAKMELQP